MCGVVAWFKETLNAHVDKREPGETSDFMSRIQKLTNGSISIDQSAYADQILEQCDLTARVSPTDFALVYFS